MAATLPTDTTTSTTIQQETIKKTTRKQWSSIQGGPRGLLRRMRSQLAEDGCPESQLVMGRTLLEQLKQEDGGEEGEEGARLAVFWLTRASLQGSTEATTLLTECLNNNIGICEHNYHEVRECLAMDLQEKLARRSAHMLFHSISDGNEVISSSSLASKVNQILSGGGEEDEERKEEEMEDNKNQSDGIGSSGSNLEKLYGGERFTEDHLVSGAVLYCQGRLPPIHHFLESAHPPQASSLLSQTVWLPWRILVTVYHSSVHFLGVTLTTRTGRVWRAVNPVTGVLVLCLLAALVSLFGGTEAAAVILPAVLSISAFAVMLASTARILLNRRRFDAFCTWSTVFSHFCPELDVEQAEGKFRSRCRMPYLVAFVAVLLYLATIPLTSPRLMVICLPVMFACFVLTFILVPERLRMWQFISLGLYLTAITPGVRESIASHLKLEYIGLDQLLVEGQYEVLGRMTVHLGVGPLLHLLWCCLQVCVAVISGPAHLPSHILSLVWCHLTVLAAQKVVTPVDVLYPLAGWSLVAIFPTASSLVLILGPAVICAGLSLHVALSYEMLVVVFLSSVLVLWASRHWWPTLMLIFKLVLLAGVVVMLLQPSVFLRTSSLRYSSLQWESFKNVCLPSKDAEAATIHGCLPLQGTIVRWKGTVTHVNIARVRNLPKTALTYLPDIVEKPLRCYLGQKLPACPVTKTPSTEVERCQLLHSVLGSDTCTLDNWNEYTFEVRISMTPSYWRFGIGMMQGFDVTLLADDTFRDFLFRLSVGDQVEFLASLSEGVGTKTPGLELSAVRCINCKAKLGFVQKQDPPASTNLHTAPIFVFNFLMGPTLTI